jgi:hypothetical protein
MPIRSNLAMTLSLAGAVVCGAAVQAQAEGPGLVHLAQAKERDLRPAGKDESRPRVALTPNAKVVQVGSWISFRVSSSVTGYLYVMSASGRAQVWMENVPIAAGQRLDFPVGRLGIKAAPPAGREDLMLIVTKRRINGFFGTGTTRTPAVVEHDHKSFKAALTEKFVDMPRRLWGYARSSVRVVDRTSPGGPAWGWGNADSDYWAGQFETD